MNRIIYAILLALTALVLFGCDKEPPAQPTAIQWPKTECFKITVTGRGMVRINYEDLAYAADVSELRTETINLYRAGKPIPILLEDGGDGKLDPGDGVVFFCGQDNPRSRTDVFFLRPIQAPERPIRYACDSVLVKQGAKISHESILRLPLRQCEAPQDLRNLGGCLTAGNLDIDCKGRVVLRAEIDTKLLDPAGPTRARLYLTLDRREEGSKQGVEHEIEISVDGEVVPLRKKLGPTQWKTACEISLNRNSQKELQITEFCVRNKTALSVQMRDAFVSAAIGIENGFLELQAEALALSGQAVLEKTSDEVAAIEARGFLSPKIRVFVPQTGKILGGTLIRQQDSGYAAVFPTAGAEIFVAAQDGAFLSASVESYEIETKHEMFLRRPDLRSPENEADYLIIVPRDFMHALKPLAELRERQIADERPMRVVTAVAEDIYDQFGHGLFGPEPIRDFIAHTQTNWRRAPRYVLLAADATRDEDFANPGRTIPCHLYRTYRSGLAGSDNYYGLPDKQGRPRIAVGRLPADDARELIIMVDKIVEYETASRIGAWQRKMQIFAGTAGYGTEVDSILEKMFDMIFGTMLPRRFDMSIAYAGENLAYYYPVENFRDHMIDKIDSGSLFAAYVGHGAVEGLDRIYRHGKTYPIFEAADADRLSSNGRRTIMLLITCSSGAYDLNQRDCLAEALMKSAGGPVAVIAGSSETHPYANGVLGIEMLPALFGRDGKCDALTLPPRAPIGDGFLAMKRQSVSGRGMMRIMLDLAASNSMGIDRADFSRIITDHLYLYNLIGDPAMRPAMPENIVLSASADTVQPGGVLKISGKCEGIDDGVATLTLECDIVSSLYPPYELQDKSVEEYAERNRRANDKIVKTYSINNIRNGEFLVLIKLPSTVEKTGAPLAPGTYFVKIFAKSETKCAFGVLKVEIESPKPKTE